MISQEIDVLKLYSGQIKGFENHDSWNLWLSDCRKFQKINELVHVRKGIQIGMASCEKKKLSNESIVNTYCRWIGSIDKTIRLILKDKQYYSKDKKTKKLQDADLESFLRDSSY